MPLPETYKKKILHFWYIDNNEYFGNSDKSKEITTKKQEKHFEYWHLSRKFDIFVDLFFAKHSNIAFVIDSIAEMRFLTSNHNNNNKKTFFKENYKNNENKIIKIAMFHLPQKRIHEQWTYLSI